MSELRWPVHTNLDTLSSFKIIFCHDKDIYKISVEVALSYSRCKTRKTLHPLYSFVYNRKPVGKPKYFNCIAIICLYVGECIDYIYWWYTYLTCLTFKCPHV